MDAINEMKDLAKNKLTESDIILDKKIYLPSEITDDIINNIPTVNYSKLTKEQIIQLNSVIKETLKEVRKDNINREVALVYDLNGYKNHDGNWLFKTTGNTDSDEIDLDKSTDISHLLRDGTKRVVVISHNHPKNRIISLLDIRTFCNTTNIFLLVAVTNSGNLSYIVKDNFNYDKYLNVSRDIIKSYGDVTISNDVFLIDLLNRCEEFGVKFKMEVRNGS